MVETARGGGGRFVKKSGNESGAISANDAGEFSGDINGATVIDPAKIGGESGITDSAPGNGGEQKRGRGRPKGFSPNKDKTETPLHIDGISAILFSVHQMLAGIAHTPELALSEDESKKMAKAAAEVAKHYDFNASAKQMAWFNLSLCAGGIYGSKFFEYSARIKEDQKKKHQSNGVSNPSPVTPVASFGIADLLRPEH